VGTTGEMISIGHESQGVYYFEAQPFVSCVAVSPPKLFHDRLDHPNLSKLRIFPSLQKLEMLDGESCQLGKYIKSLQNKLKKM